MRRFALVLFLFSSAQVTQAATEISPQKDSKSCSVMENSTGDIVSQCVDGSIVVANTRNNVIIVCAKTTEGKLECQKFNLRNKEW